MTPQNLVNLWREYQDESMSYEPYSFGEFMDWLQDADTTPNEHRYPKLPKESIKEPSSSDPSPSDGLDAFSPHTDPTIDPPHVQGRRYACLTKSQIVELLHEVCPEPCKCISEVRERINKL